jgi:dienelactone hydrolase
VTYSDLGAYSDWVGFADPLADPGPHASSAMTPAEARMLLGFARDGIPIEPRIEAEWTADGIHGEEVSWSVGYGPRTRSWLLKPAGETRALPGVLALHDHSGFKFLGKEKIADGPGGADPRVSELRRLEYEGLAFANRLALRGFAVLVPDVFMWGSRRFEWDLVVSDADRSRPREQPVSGSQGTPAFDEVGTYNRAARDHEHVIAKYCSLLGTTLAGVIAFEDRVAVSYLQSRPDVSTSGVGCIGLSGGGCRAALLQATSDQVSVAVVVGMMSTYRQLLDRHVAPHSWMFFPPGLSPRSDWPTLAACRAPSPLVVQYVLGDELFSEQGMFDAHARIAAHYRSVGAPNAYVGQFFEGRHWFNRAMQDDAFIQLETWMLQ